MTTTIDCTEPELPNRTFFTRRCFGFFCWFCGLTMNARTNEPESTEKIPSPPLRTTTNTAASAATTSSALDTAATTSTILLLLF